MTAVDFESRENADAICDHPLGGKIIVLGTVGVTTYTKGGDPRPVPDEFLDVLIIRKGRKRRVKVAEAQFDSWLAMLGGAEEPKTWKHRGRGFKAGADWRGPSQTITPEARKHSRDIAHIDDPPKHKNQAPEATRKHFCPQPGCDFFTWSKRGLGGHSKVHK